MEGKMEYLNVYKSILGKIKSSIMSFMKKITLNETTLTRIGFSDLDLQPVSPFPRFILNLDFYHHPHANF